MNEHERGFLAFLSEPTRGRMETLLDLGAKRRLDVRRLLHNSVRLDQRFCQHLDGAEAFPAAVEDMLRKRGAPATCYVLGSGDLDGNEISLVEALGAVIGNGNGAFVSCVPGRLGFYEYGSVKSCWLLSR